MSRLPILLLLLPMIGCSNEPAALPQSDAQEPLFTPGSGVTPNLLGQATFDIGKIKRTTGNWEVELETKPAMELAVRMFSYAAHSTTGWHSHPGPVFIQVVQGEVTFYEGDDPNCEPIVVRRGESYLDLGDHPHIGRNESDQPAQDLVVLFGPPGIPSTGFRIDEPDPGNCPF
jgi:quercetin dioxygenase-like cupin family protein